MFRFIANHPQGNSAIGKSRLFGGGFFKIATKLRKKS